MPEAASEPPSYEIKTLPLYLIYFFFFSDLVLTLDLGVYREQLATDNRSLPIGDSLSATISKDRIFLG